MGEFISTQCPNCDDYEDFMIGVGMMDAFLKDVLPSTKGKARRIAKEIVFNVLDHEAEYEHQLLTCPKCDTLHSRFYLKVIYDEGKVYETTFLCGKCRTPLVKLTKPISEHRCKKCGSHPLEEGIAGVWD